VAAALRTDPLIMRTAPPNPARRSLGLGAMLIVAALIAACAAPPEPTPATPDWRADPDEPYPFTTPIPALSATAVDGAYTRPPTDHYQGLRAPCTRCPPYPLDRGASVLTLDRGRYQVQHVEPAFQGTGHYLVDGDRLLLFNDAECTHDVGEYRWSLDDGALRLEVIRDPCAYDQRAKDFSFHPWQVADAADPACQPPDEEAAVTGHWPVPSGC
jgi:hypothetical protein